MWSGNVKTALANLRSAKWRSILTMMGIIIGISSVVTVVSLGEGLKGQVVGQINKLGSDVITVRSGRLVQRSDGSISGLNLLAFLNTSTLTQQDVTTVAKLPTVNSVTPIDFVTSSVASGDVQLDNAFVFGSSPALPDLLHQKIAYGDFFSDEDAGQNFAVIGPNIASQVFGQLNPSGHSLNINGQDFIVHGVLAPSSGSLLSVGQVDFNSAVIIPFDSAKKVANNQTNILQILVRSKDSNPDAAVAEIQKQLFANHNKHEDFTVLKQDELLGIVSGVVDTATRFISAIAAISLLVGGIGIMDIMLVSVTERTREIGIRKAVGATNRQILNQFLVEGLALTIVGGVIGVILSLLINVGLKIYTDWQPVINIPIVVLAVAVSVAVGVIFSITPALKAARKDPINALRGE